MDTKKFLAVLVNKNLSILLIENEHLQIFPLRTAKYF